MTTNRDEQLENRKALLRYTLEHLQSFVHDSNDLFKNVVPGVDPVDTSSALATVKLARDFLGLELLQKAYLNAPAEALGRQPINDLLLQHMAQFLADARLKLAEQSEMELVGSYFSAIRDLVFKAIQKTRQRTMIDLRPAELDDLESDLDSIEDRLRILDATSTVSVAVGRINSAADQAEESAAKASNAAGRTAEIAISSYYENLSTTESAAADRFRRWTIWAGMGAGLTAAAFLILPEFGWLRIAGTDYAHLLQRVIVTAAVFGLAGYFARQAQQHRSLANWAAALAVQLKTFEAYIEPIDDQDARNELRKSFAARAFGDHPAMKGESPPTPSPAAMDAAVDLVAKLTPGSK